jgi:hypothetical protein
MKLKVGLRDLEEALRNPGAWAREQGGKGKSRYSRFNALRSTALDFHKNNDVTVAQKLLEERFRKSFRVTKGNDEYFEMLDTYATSFAALGTTFVRARDNIVVSLPDEFDDQFQVSGQIARLDMHPDGGYRAWMFARKADPWQGELRFPLLQTACAQQLNVPLEEVVPGMYEFSTGVYTQCQYTKRQVQAAMRKLSQLLKEIKQTRSQEQKKQ